MKPTICAIAAVGPENIIGIGDRMPWHSQADFYHFRKTTMGYPCVFGRKTFQGLPKHPLPGRLNIVCSTRYNNTWGQDGVFLASGIESAIEQSRNFDQIFICGGAGIYDYALNHDLIDIFYLTRVDIPALADQIKENPDRYTYFPKDLGTFFSPDRWQSKKSYIRPTFYQLKSRQFRQPSINLHEPDSNKHGLSWWHIVCLAYQLREKDHDTTRTIESVKEGDRRRICFCVG